MPRLFRPIFSLISMLGFLGPTVADETSPGWWSDLAVRDLNDGAVSVHGRWIVVVFISPECPVANASIPVLNALAAEFAPAGVDFVGVYADPTIKLKALCQHTADYHLRFPTVDDRAQRLVHLTGATYTPETFVFSKEGALLYRSRIDDRASDFGSSRPTATHQDLRDVLRMLIAGQPAPFARRPGFGCSIPEVVKQ